MARLLVIVLLSWWPFGAAAEAAPRLIEAPAAERLDLATSTLGSVRIRGWDQARVEIRVAEPPGVRVEVKHDARQVEVRVHQEARAALTPVDLEIRLPAQMDVYAVSEESTLTVGGLRSDVELWAEHGDVHAADLAGRLQVNTTSGNIDVTRISGVASLSTPHGSIVTEGIAGQLEADTVSGGIRVTDARARTVRLTSDHGALTYRGSLEAGGDYDLASQSGRVELLVSGEMGARYEIGTLRGHLDSNLPFPAAAKPGDRVTLEVGGGEARVRIITFSGDIRVQASP